MDFGIVSDCAGRDSSFDDPSEFMGSNDCWVCTVKSVRSGWVVSPENVLRAFLVPLIPRSANRSTRLKFCEPGPTIRVC